MAHPDFLPGQPVLNPDGRQIRLPCSVMAQLRRMRLLEKNRIGPRKERSGEPSARISRRIYALLAMGAFLTHTWPRTPKKSLMPKPDSLRSGAPQSKISILAALGRDCMGPAVTICECSDCRSRAKSRVRGSWKRKRDDGREKDRRQG